MSIETLVILGLAIHEALQLWFNGSIFVPVRQALMWPRTKRPKVLVFGLLYELVNCPVCMSVWVGGFILSVWFLVPKGHYLIWLLAAIDIAQLSQALTVVRMPAAAPPSAPPSQAQAPRRPQVDLKVGGR